MLRQNYLDTGERGEGLSEWLARRHGGRRAHCHSAVSSGGFFDPMRGASGV
jgi:hypothetical protein